MPAGSPGIPVAVWEPLAVRVLWADYRVVVGWPAKGPGLASSHLLVGPNRVPVALQLLATAPPICLVDPKPDLVVPSSGLDGRSPNPPHRWLVAERVHVVSVVSILAGAPVTAVAQTAAMVPAAVGEWSQVSPEFVVQAGAEPGG